MSIKPLKDRVIAKKQAPQEKTASGILLGEAKESPNTATVEAIGPEVKSIKKGDQILYKDYSATTVKVDGAEYLVISEEDILATI